MENNFNFLRVDHSRTLVEDYVWNYNRATVSSSLTVEEVYRNKALWRPELQKHATLVGFSDPNKAEIWINETLAQWDGKQDVVFDPIRGDLQAQILKRRGFVIVQLEIDEFTRMMRAGADYERVLEAMGRTDIEAGVMEPDIVMKGDLDPNFAAAWLVGLGHRVDFKDGAVVEKPLTNVE